MSTTSTEQDMPAIRVHVAGTDVPIGGQPRRRVRRATFRTINLVAGVYDLLPEDPARLCAWIQAGGASVVVCTSLGDAQDPANQVAGLPAPVGLVVPYTNTAPMRLEGAQRMWVAAPADAQVTLQVIHEGPA